MNTFSMTDLKSIKLFLGIRIDRSNDQISLDQSAYIKIIQEKFKISDCNPVTTSLPSKSDYTALSNEEKYDVPCRNLIGY